MPPFKWLPIPRWKSDGSGQFITTSQEFSPQMVVKSKGNPLISGKSRLVKYYSIWPDGWVDFSGDVRGWVFWVDVSRRVFVGNESKGRWRKLI